MNLIYPYSLVLAYTVLQMVGYFVSKVILFSLKNANGNRMCINNSRDCFSYHPGEYPNPENVLFLAAFVFGLAADGLAPFEAEVR